MLVNFFVFLLLQQASRIHHLLVESIVIISCVCFVQIYFHFHIAQLMLAILIIIIFIYHFIAWDLLLPSINHGAYFSFDDYVA